MSAALGALSAERSGAGSALTTAMRQVGATIGVAVLGTILNNVYQSHLTGAGLPAALTAAARRGLAAGVTVAHQTHSAALLAAVRHSFVNGLDTAGAAMPPDSDETAVQRAELGL
ncbi:MAG TPA: hypothetical protein VG268_11935 [Streptosporangiaceae bacterium]|nr:hypothetical protein [Streptosporangiaceae bacterium]